MAKLLIGTNLTNKQFGLERVDQKRVVSSIASNFRKLLHNMGYNCSLLTDNEILAFEELIYDAEHDSDDSMGCNTYLIEVLDFMCDKSLVKTGE